MTRSLISDDALIGDGPLISDSVVAVLYYIIIILLCYYIIVYPLERRIAKKRLMTDDPRPLGVISDKLFNNEPCQ